jgi:transcriptional regulator GlxA family with amidase domain
LGAFVLAEAGLLDGRRATTHWHWADHFAQRFPRVELDRDVLYVADGRVITSAGTAASLDCCLHLLRCDQGAEIAARVARRLVVAPHRQGGQAQFIEQPVAHNDQGDHLHEVLDWASAHLDRAHSLDTLAKRARMSRRSFTRHFRKLTGTSVNPWLAAQRVALAQRLLETSDASVEQIADSVGFGSALALRQHFAAQLRTSPSQYRRAFRA